MRHKEKKGGVKKEREQMKKGRTKNAERGRVKMVPICLGC